MKPVANEVEEGGLVAVSSGGADYNSRHQSGKIKRLESIMESKFRDIDNLLNKKVLKSLQDIDTKTIQRLQSIESTN